jgi:alkyl sulfatase BDS1-like metallo-beta-lactamase superfamily hydrolase
MDDRQDFADADRGLIAGFPDRKLLHADGSLLFDLSRLDYITDDAPAPGMVNPSLWRQSQVMRRGRLYKVTDGLYQARNNDIANLTCGENANHTLDNIQTLRGARTRDARNFARYLDETLQRWGDEAQVHYGPHTWPVWGNASITAFIESQRDTYKYIQTRRCGWPTRATRRWRRPR